MNIREEIKKYKSTKAELELIKMEIEDIHKIPLGAQVLSDMPTTHSNESKTEIFAIKNTESKELEELREKEEKLEKRLKRVNAALLILDNEEKDYIGYYTEGITQDELSKKYFIELESVQKKIQRILDKVEDFYKKVA